MKYKVSSIDKSSSNSPSDYDRYIILENELKKENREDDLKNIIELMSPPKDIRNICTSYHGKNFKVAIIGAGEAGLAAAYELKKIGCNITIFEASKRIGGRVYTYYFDRNNNYYGDFGEESISISDYTTWHYINLFNLETYPIINKKQYYYLRNIGSYNKETQIIKNIYPLYNLTKLDKKKLRCKEDLNIYNKYLSNLTVNERKELLQIKKNYSKNIVELDRLTLKKAYELEGFSEEAINMIGYINGSKEWYNFGFLEALQKKYILDSINNYSIVGGMIRLPQAMYSAIIEEDLKSYSNIKKEELGIVNIRLGFSIEEISRNNDKIILKYCEVENKLQGNEEFDFVIITVPFSSMKRINVNNLFSIDKRRAIDEIKIENSQKVYLYLRERFWEKGRKDKRIIGGKTITDLPIYSICYPSDNAIINYNKDNNENINLKVSQSKSGVLLASCSIGDKANEFAYLTDNIKIDDTIRYIEKIHNLENGYLNDILLDYNCMGWSDVQYLWGFSNIYKPEDKTLYSYSSITPEIDNKVFFAGDNASIKHGSQQGELQSGIIAANSVAEEIIKKY